MTEVYIVLSGDYHEREIEGVYANRDAAQVVVDQITANHVYDARVEAWTVWDDPEPESIYLMTPRWRVRVTSDGHVTVTPADRDAYACDGEDLNHIWSSTVPKGRAREITPGGFITFEPVNITTYHVLVAAEGAESARKTALDLIARYRAEHGHGGRVIDEDGEEFTP